MFLRYVSVEDFNSERGAQMYPQMYKIKPYEKMMEELRLQLHQAEHALTATLRAVENTKKKLGKLATQHPELTHILNKEEEKLAQVGKKFSRDEIAAAKTTLRSLKKELTRRRENPKSGAQSKPKVPGKK